MYFVNIGQGLDYLSVTIDGNTSKTSFHTVTPIDLLTNPTYTTLKMPYVPTLDYYDPATGQYIVNDASANPYYSPEFYYTLDFSSKNKTVYETLGWMLGFRETKYTIDIFNTFVTSVYSSVGTITFLGSVTSESSFGSNYSNYIFLEVDDFNNNNQINTIFAFNGQKSYISNNILARLSMDNVPYTILQKNNADRICKKREYYGPVRIDKLRIRLLNRFGKAIDLNKNDYSFVLEFQQIYS